MFYIPVHLVSDGHISVTWRVQHTFDPSSMHRFRWKPQSTLPYPSNPKPLCKDTWDIFQLILWPVYFPKGTQQTFPHISAATKTIYYSRRPSPSVILLTKTGILSHNTMFSSPQLSGFFCAKHIHSDGTREKKKIKTPLDVKSQHKVQKRPDWVENVSLRPVMLELCWVVNSHNKSY